MLRILLNQLLRRHTHALRVRIRIFHECLNGITSRHDWSFVDQYGHREHDYDFEGNGSNADDGHAQTDLQLALLGRFLD